MSMQILMIHGQLWYPGGAVMRGLLRDAQGQIDQRVCRDVMTTVAPRSMREILWEK